MFLLNGLALVPMVCRAGLADRAELHQGSDGTGPYTLTKAVSGDESSYTRHVGYAWGPNGAGNDARGQSAQVVFQVVADQASAVLVVLAGAVLAVSGKRAIRQAPGPGASRRGIAPSRCRRR